MSLSQEPAFSLLKSHFVCGVRDITGEPYAGKSGKHDVDGKAIRTTNGAGPHNLQLFFLASDGTVLHCLPGYWSPQDLAHEMELAYKLNEIWRDPSLARNQKNHLFAQYQLAHLQSHPPDMVKRSKMQGFDQKFEAEHRLYTSDTIKNVSLLEHNTDKKLPQEAFKTTDEIVHERMAKRPFVPFDRFDTAQYTDYGRQKYDKKEDLRTADGKLPPQVGKSGGGMNSTAMKRTVVRRLGKAARRQILNKGIWHASN